MAYGKIIAGKFKGTDIYKGHFLWAGETIYFNNLFAQSYSLVNQSKDGSWSGALVGGLVLGAGGAVMGASGKN